MKFIYISNACNECIYFRNGIVEVCTKTRNAWGNHLSIRQVRKEFEDCESFERKKKENEMVM